MKTDIPRFPFYTLRNYSTGKEWTVTCHLSPLKCVSVNVANYSIEVEDRLTVTTTEFDNYCVGKSEVVDREYFDRAFEQTLKNIVNLVEPTKETAQ
jgi:hypothetical protein